MFQERIIMKNIYFKLIILIVTLNKVVLPQESSNLVNYCKKNKDTFIAIVWPITQGKTQEIENLFSS